MDFEIDGRHFRAEKLSAMQQLNLSRKIAPLLPSLIPALVKLSESGGGISANILQLAELAAPFAKALSELTDADAEAILTVTLASVKVQTDVTKNVWVPLWVPAAQRAMVEELNDLAELLPIVFQVVAFNLGNFTRGLRTSPGAALPEPSGGTSPAGMTGTVSH